MHLIYETCDFQISYVIFQANMQFVWTEYYMLEKHVIFPFSSINYMFSVNYTFFAEYYGRRPQLIFNTFIIASRAIEKSTKTEGSKRHCFPHTLLKSHL